jgi:hypothetical protein
MNSYSLLNIFSIIIPSELYKQNKDNIINPNILNDVILIFREVVNSKQNLSLKHFAQLLQIQIPCHQQIIEDDLDKFKVLDHNKFAFLAHLNFYFMKIWRIMNFKTEKKILPSLVITPITQSTPSSVSTINVPTVPSTSSSVSTTNVPTVQSAPSSISPINTPKNYILDPNILQKFSESNLRTKQISNVKKCFVFDFDCTITATHYYALMFDSNPDTFRNKFNPVLKQFGYDKLTNFELKQIIDLRIPLDQDRRIKFINLVYGGLERFQLLVFFFTALKQMNYDLFISSKGLCSVITQNLVTMGLNVFFSGINGRGEGNCWKGNKSDFMRALSQTYQTIIYVDDDNDFDLKIQENPLPPGINYQYFGANIGLTKEKFGLDKEMIISILNYAYEK